MHALVSSMMLRNLVCDSSVGMFNTLELSSQDIVVKCLSLKMLKCTGTNHTSLLSLASPAYTLACFLNSNICCP